MDGDSDIYCPQCKKTFDSESNVLRHMNNRLNTRCNPWLKELMHYTSMGAPEGKHYQRAYEAAMGRSFSTAGADGYDGELGNGDGDMEVDDNHDHGGDDHMIDDTLPFNGPETYGSNIQSFNLPGALPFRTQINDSKSNHFYAEKYEGASKTFGKGPTVMDAFEKDRFHEHRRQNLYYPFASKDEWFLSLFLVRSSLTMAELDEFLRLPLVSRMNLSYRSAKDLRGRVELLPEGPQWRVLPLAVPGFPTKTPIRLFYRDPLECMKAMFANPLLAGHLQLIPTKLYEDQTHESRVYHEWMTSDTAWKMQGSIPPGATILGTILTSDKTNISVLSGDRVAHPLLMSIANIDTNVLMKATAFFFQLIALVPCPKFLCHKDFRGVAESRLLHDCIDRVCAPLKRAALAGLYMPDPRGDIRWCFTPLAAYIVDTPEAAVLACVGGKTSHVTMASWKQFGDSFQHEIRSGSTTLAQIAEVSSRIPADNVKDFTKEAKKKYRLNGVHRPFWRDWPLSNDPARFLTPEPLHHWHKFFFDHDMKWVCSIVGEAEVDFRFSTLQPRIGYRHFGEGVSRLKQCTGREHREMQRHIVSIMADAAPNGAVICIRALLDFRYIGQMRTITAGQKLSLQAALDEFHQNKSQLLAAGARAKLKNGPNWYIPKLEFMQSVAGSIAESGVPMQWSADPTEKAHHTYIKEPARDCTNNRDYDPQIVRHLDRTEKTRMFELTTAIQASGVDLRAVIDSMDGDIVVDPTRSRAIRDLFQDVTANTKGATLQSDRVFASPTTAFSVNYHPDIRTLPIESVAEKFGIPDLYPALRDYIYSDGLSHSLGRRRQGTHSQHLPFTHLQVWYSVRVQTKPIDDALELSAPVTLEAQPPCEDWPMGRYDCALFHLPSRQGEQCQWPPKPTILSSHIAAQLRVVFRPILQDTTISNPLLAYILRFDATRITPDPVTGMYPMKRARRADNSRFGGVIPLRQLRMPLDLAPRFGKKADKRLSKTNVMEACEEFWLNKYWDKEFYVLF